MAQEDQEQERNEDGKGRGDAKTCNDYLAHAPLGEAISVSLRSTSTSTEEGRPSVAEGGFRRHRRQSSFSEERKIALKVPVQDKGETMTVGPSYSSAGCSSAEPASASLDTNRITYKKRKGKNNQKKHKKLIVCLSNRLRTVP